MSGLQILNNHLIGVCLDGGSSKFGVLFDFDIGLSSYSALQYFSTSFGVRPNGNVMLVSSNKYNGTTTAEGDDNMGVLYQYEPVTEIYGFLVNPNI